MPEIEGLCNVEVKPFGPVQLQLVASVAPPVNVNTFPAHIGFVLTDAVINEGTLFTVTEAVLTIAAPHALLAVNL